MEFLKPFCIPGGDILYLYGKIPRDVFFLVKGIVWMKDRDDAVFKTYFGGSYFGEVEVIFKTTRKATAQVEGACTLLRINEAIFLEILKE